MNVVELHPREKKSDEGPTKLLDTIKERIDAGSVDGIYCVITYRDDDPETMWSGPVGPKSVGSVSILGYRMNRFLHDD